MRGYTSFVLIAAACLAGVLLAAFLHALCARRRLERRVQILEVLEAAVRRGLVLGPILARCAAGQRGRMQRGLMAAARALQQGSDLAGALALGLPRLFTPNVTATMRAAEGGGHLTAILRTQVGDGARQDGVRHRLILALFYPLVLAVLLAGFFTLMNHVVGRLPGQLVRVPPFWAAMAAAVLGGTVLTLLHGWARSGRGRPASRLAGFLPFLRRIGELANGEQMLRAVAAHVATGSTLARALEAAGAGRAAQSVMAGEPAVTAWAATPLPAFARARAAAASAHEGLALAGALEVLAGDCAARLERRLARATAWLQPVALLVAGALLALQFAAVVAWYDGVRKEVELW